MQHSVDLGDRKWLRTDFGVVWYTSIYPHRPTPLLIHKMWIKDVFFNPSLMVEGNGFLLCYFVCLFVRETALMLNAWYCLSFQEFKFSEGAVLF